MNRSLPPAYFDALYADDADPWSFATSPYEAAKYDATLAALPRARYASALEVGCSIGILTRRLAPRCDRLLGIDVAPAALAANRARNADLPNLRLVQAGIPRDWPDGTFDLILLSEVLYYLDEADAARAARQAVAAAARGATVLLVHWLGPTDYPATGDHAADRFIAATASSLALLRQFRTPEYRLDCLVRE